jgi:hypothetical protein
MRGRCGLAGLVAGLIAMASLATAAPPSLTTRLLTLDRATVWKPAGAIAVRFETFHPQGMVRIGDEFFVSSVEIRRAPAFYPKPQGGHDRDAGSGVGHLFRISAKGELLGDLVLGEGDAYHAGGLDYDGQFLWVPVAEYRPDSRTIVYRVDPGTMTAAEAFRVADHIGALARDRVGGRLHGVSWGGRRFYDWPMGEAGRPSGPAQVSPNRSSYIDYQDCHHLDDRRMLCSGLAGYRPPPPGPPFALGGWEMVDLRDHRPVWQTPIALWTPAGAAMTRNPFFAELTPTGVRAYFMPEDDRSTIYTYDAAPRP